MKVMLVFDEAYGRRGAPGLGDAFWLIESPANRAIAERAWKVAATDPNSAIFRSQIPPAPLDVLAKVEQIDLHHPGWSEIVVIGVDSSWELTAALEVEGLTADLSSGSLSIRRRRH